MIVVEKNPYFMSIYQVAGGGQQSVAPQSRLQHPGCPQHRQHSQVRRICHLLGILPQFTRLQGYNAQCNLYFQAEVWLR